jgi:hypothetical protein
VEGTVEVVGDDDAKGRLRLLRVQVHDVIVGIKFILIDLFCTRVEVVPQQVKTRKLLGLRFEVLCPFFLSLFL